MYWKQGNGWKGGSSEGDAFPKEILDGKREKKQKKRKRGKGWNCSQFWIQPIYPIAT